MLFSKKTISIYKDDEIIWKYVYKGHNIEFKGLPKGASKNNFKINKEVKYKFTVPGIYLYQCTPHKSMGMNGVVIVDDDKSNLSEIKKVRVYGK